MSNEDLKRPLTTLLAPQRQKLQEAQVNLGNLDEEAIERWHELEPIISNDVLPQLKTWQSELQRLGRPISLGKFHAERQRTERAARMIWLWPQTLYLLLQISILGIGVFCQGVYLVIRDFATALLELITSLLNPPEED